MSVYELGSYAIIHVRDGASEAWPVVTRTYGGGWQSGAHHYPDAEVLDVTPLRLVEDDPIEGVTP